MAEPLTSRIEAEVMAAIRKMGENVVVKARFMPDKPDRCVLVTARASGRPADRHGDAARTYSLQVRVRDPALAIDLADRIDAFLSLRTWSANIDALYWESTGDLGRDAKGRDEITYNYEVVANATRTSTATSKEQ